MICKDKLAQSVGPVVAVGDEPVRFAVLAAHQRAVRPPKRLPDTSRQLGRSSPLRFF